MARFDASVRSARAESTALKSPAESARSTHVAKAIAAFAGGEFLVVSDDESRENEADLVLAAQHATPEKLAFLVRHTCGIVCAPVSDEVALRLRLSPMVAQNEAPLATAFTVSVDSRDGVTTGISATERAKTLLDLARSDAQHTDFVRPGHIFPLIAKSGGTLERAGHTEAAVDLCRLAGLSPVGVICELCNDDGSVMRGEEIVRFAATHQIPRLTVADLIVYRQTHDLLVSRVQECNVLTRIGFVKAISYASALDDVEQLAFVFGDLRDGVDVPLFVHRADLAKDLFAGAGPAEFFMDRVQAFERGIMLFLRNSEGYGDTHRSSLRSLRDDHRAWLGNNACGQILRDLRVHSIKIMNAVHEGTDFSDLAKFGIGVSA